MLALLIDKIGDISQSYLSYSLLLLLLYPAINKRVSIILLNPSAGKLLPGATDSWILAMFGLDELIPQLFLFVEAEIEGDEMIEAGCEVEGSKDMMGVSRNNFFVSSLDLCVGFFEKEHP
jgi:hypothetical protein